MTKGDETFLGYILAIIILFVLPYLLISSCAHNSGNNGSYTSYERDEEVRDYGKVIYYQGQWQ